MKALMGSQTGSSRAATILFNAGASWLAAGSMPEDKAERVGEIPELLITERRRPVTCYSAKPLLLESFDQSKCRVEMKS